MLRVTSLSPDLDHTEGDTTRKAVRRILITCALTTHPKECTLQAARPCPTAGEAPTMTLPGKDLFHLSSLDFILASRVALFYLQKLL